MTIFAQRALVGAQWSENVRLTHLNGMIQEIVTDTAAAPGDTCVDILLPALCNLHSHAFQRAMAGRTEVRAQGRDSFWTWRDLMYRFVDALTPEHIEAIAAQTYLEMLEAGYASVGEFHYIHHQPGGQPYEDLGELSQRIFSAAATSGIGLTHLPVLYSYAGVHQEPLSGGQLRFANSADQYLALVDAAASAMTSLTDLPADSRIGIAPHSLRATSAEGLQHIVEAHPQAPVHIHISEQTKEVEDVVAAFGRRPVNWLLDEFPVDDRWCLIHATHMSDEETIRLAKSGAVAGLCPITESNLGDGIFNGAVFLEHGGRFGVGSDSNVRISLNEELRTLEYSQRLRDRARNVMVPQSGSVGHALYTGAASGGAQALGRAAGDIAVGKLADLVALDGQASGLWGLQGDEILDGLCFATGDRAVCHVWSAGRHMVRDGRHIAHGAITQAFRAAMADLLQRL